MPRGRQRRGGHEAEGGAAPEAEGREPLPKRQLEASQQNNEASVAEGPLLAPADSVASANLTSADYYFDSYAHFGIHEQMLKDRARTEAYRDAIYKNKHLFVGKVVLDVGCGTGILSMFAAKAGAHRVIGIECASIVDQAREIVEANGLSGVVTILHGKCEDVTLPDDIQHVDVIISEWMGYFLLYESMLNTVITARDRWLDPQLGILFPDHATLCLCGIEDEEYKREKIDFWDNVYGFDMTPVKRLALLEPLVDVVDPGQVCTGSDVVLRINLYDVTLECLTFSSPFTITASRDDYVHAIVAHWDAVFSACHKPITLSTAPHAPITHWKQTVFYLDEVLTLRQGEQIHGNIHVKPNAKNHRDIDIRLEVEVDGDICTSRTVTDYRLR
eukprot:CAMPEP_0181197010 /NCGR_PEP_ID=MMETSP1096-20121128/15792_1 /TAXON_ID=156174 ORGANISM="Chrysochromulina ericina, Strain CCMP281" /NCGR_SAMPLE_ID=MMETSP1096 /ASSEMBLY_ACC=CAM_ASM_000453 /LENGTH=387 /DNA_ID=CAMNT_0023286851 /DNA_START=65 /DNA_END=1228 /DNA_ORIENTATION=-